MHWNWGWTALYPDRSSAEAIAAQYPVNSDVTVFYDPTRPETAVLDPTNKSGVAAPLWVGLFLIAIGLILIMLGAIQKKIFVWHTGFWGEKASGWHYDLLFVVMNLVILLTNGGAYVLLR